MSELINIGSAARSLETAPVFAEFTGVRIWYDDENGYFSGDETGRVLETECPWATQEMADNLLASVAGYAYQPLEAAGAVLDPAAELGDVVRVGGVASVLAAIDTTFDGLCASDIAAPADEEVDHEYPYETSTQRQLSRKLTLGRSYYGTKVTKANGLEITRTDANGGTNSRAVLNSDKLAFYDDGGTEALYFDPATGRYMFRGDIVVDGNIDMSSGSISWGNNNPAESVDSALKTRYGITYTTIGKASIESPLIKGDEIQAYGSFQCLAKVDSAAKVTGYMGSAFGSDADGNTTYGVAMSQDYSSANGLGNYYVIVTDAGVRLQAGSNRLTLTANGVYVNGYRVLTTQDLE